MFWLLTIVALLLNCRNTSKQSQKDSYITNPQGHWVNRGTAFDERWEWWEPKSNKILLYVSVVENEGKYTIIVNNKPPKKGIEYVNCTEKREAKIAISLYHSYYSVLGTVDVADYVGIELNKIKI
ncbi:hypothetical protein GNP92_11125 [Paenibacillus timonensis]|nr:hypothetical protein [Paenibacillus timonensis]MUG86892.1 hypothetical protein [Paenibacillus timonensis]